jgi:hypothetical protein
MGRPKLKEPIQRIGLVLVPVGMTVQDIVPVMMALVTPRAPRKKRL